jgi:hypothetical protein
MGVRVVGEGWNLGLGLEGQAWRVMVATYRGLLENHKRAAQSG